ncbi:BON domain-containing protein [Stenotrophomonas sp.]|uniref:BON domain-containing protein n=1 Tax=Stenotrophomonas sp. TaxID=69392 RepID=UPI0028A861CA|nr:BON domain-containing protein [Stenotrophomonas sp.]
MNIRKTKQLLCAGVIALSFAGAAVTAQAAGQAMQGHDSEQPGTDTWITTKVKAELLTTKDVSGLEIKVETVNGVVTLSGTVASQAEVDRAVTAAKGVEGVKSVDSSALTAAAVR